MTQVDTDRRCTTLRCPCEGNGGSCISSSWRWPQETLVDGVQVDEEVVHRSILAHQRGSRATSRVRAGDQMRKAGSDSWADTYISTRLCSSADRTTFFKLLTSACTC